MMSNSTAMAMTHGFALILVEYVERCRVLALDEQKVRELILLVRF